MTTYFVATDGNNGAAGAILTPFKTPQHAIDVATNPNDVVYLRGGTYNAAGGHLAAGLLHGASGSAGSPILFSAYNSEPVIFDFNTIDVGNYAGIHTNSKSYLNWNGVEVKNVRSTGSGGDAFRIYGTSGHFGLANMILHDCDSSGIRASKWDASAGITNVTIDGCTIYNSNHLGDQEAISLVNVNTFEIKNCIVHDVQGIDHYDNNKEGIDCKEGTSNGSVHDNIVYNARYGVYIDASGVNVDNIDIYNNYVHDNDNGMGLGEEGGTATITDVNYFLNRVDNNTNCGFVALPYNGTATFTLERNRFYHNGTADNTKTIWITQNLTYVNCTIKNNIFNENSNYIPINYQDAGGEAGITVDHNMFWDGDGVINASNIAGTNPIYCNPVMIGSGSGTGV